MARPTQAQVMTLGPGRHSFGDTLTLLTGKNGVSRSWVQRLTVAGARVDIGIGPARVVSLKLARRAALENRLKAWQGVDPRPKRNTARVLTFREAAKRTLEANKARWTGRTVSSWQGQLERYAFPKLGGMAVNRIGRADVLGVLTPIWSELPTTARKVRQAIKQILGWAVAHGYIDGNVADAGIDGALPAMPAIQAHHEALPYGEVAAALAAVETEPRVSEAVRLCLWLQTLTAVRPGEARGAMWSEIDLAAAEWAIPAARMKGKKGLRREHRVPLSIAAIGVLERAAKLRGDSDLVFPSPATGRPLSDVAVPGALRRVGVTATAHGMRSSFRDWCSEQTDTPREIAEAALAHVTGNETERAYMRSDLFDKRRALMSAWAAYVLTS